MQLFNVFLEHKHKSILKKQFTQIWTLHQHKRQKYDMGLKRHKGE